MFAVCILHRCGKFDLFLIVSFCPESKMFILPIKIMHTLTHTGVHILGDHYFTT